MDMIFENSALQDIFVKLLFIEYTPSREDTPYSGAPARAKRAWDRATYSWNMVNLFSFGCDVIFVV